MIRPKMPLKSTRQIKNKNFPGWNSV